MGFVAFLDAATKRWVPPGRTSEVRGPSQAREIPVQGAASRISNEGPIGARVSLSSNSLIVNAGETPAAYLVFYISIFTVFPK